MDINKLIDKQALLMKLAPHDVSVLNVERLVAGKGLTEEVHEYLNAVGVKPWRPNPLSEKDQLEELTDILFFYLELIVLSGFSFAQIEKEYYRKWDINIERYRKGEKGDYSWDTRATKTEL